MGLVVDANILFPVLIKSGKTEELMFEPELHLYAPEFIFEELEKYFSLILEKTYRNEPEFLRIFEIIKNKIKTIANEETEDYLPKAEKICPDKKDVDYFALALRLKCSIWSNDRLLKNQQIIPIYSTSDLLNMF